MFTRWRKSGQVLSNQIRQHQTSIVRRRYYQHQLSSLHSLPSTSPIMAAHALPKYLTGDKAAINEFIDKFDVRLR